MIARPSVSGSLWVATSHVADSSSSATARLPATHGTTTAAGRARQSRSAARVSAQPRTNASCSVLITKLDRQRDA
jgi:hypothetical protein